MTKEEEGKDGKEEEEKVMGWRKTLSPETDNHLRFILENQRKHGKYGRASSRKPLGS